jgi:hypothetical protein
MIARSVENRSSFATARPVLPEPPITPKVAERFIACRNVLEPV